MATTEIMDLLRQATSAAPPPKSKYWERHILVEWGVIAPPRTERISLPGQSLTMPSPASQTGTPPGGIAIPTGLLEKMEAQGLTFSGLGITRGTLGGLTQGLEEGGRHVQEGLKGLGIKVPEGLQKLAEGLGIGDDWSLVTPMDEPPPWLTQQPEILFSDEWEWYWPGGKRRYMEFEANFEKAGSSNTAELKVWNLSDEKLERYYEALREAGIGPDSQEEEMTKGFIPFMRVYAGYGDWLPLIFTGKIASIPETRWQKADKVTKFSLIDDEESRLPRWRCPGGAGSYFPPGTMMSDIVKALIKDLGIPLGAPVELGVDYPTKSGISYAATKSTREALLELAQETESVMYLVNSKIYFVPKWYGIPTNHKVWRRTGLIWTSRPIHYPRWGGTEEIVFCSLLNPLLTLDALVEVEDHSFSGKVRIEAVHIRINRQDYYCECRGAIFNEDEARKEREEAAKAKLALLNKGRDPSKLVPLRLENFVIRDFTPPPGAGPEIPQLEAMPDVQSMPYWDFKLKRWVDPKAEGGG